MQRVEPNSPSAQSCHFYPIRFAPLFISVNLTLKALFCCSSLGGLIRCYIHTPDITRIICTSQFCTIGQQQCFIIFSGKGTFKSLDFTFGHDSPFLPILKALASNLNTHVFIKYQGRRNRSGQSGHGLSNFGSSKVAEKCYIFVSIFVLVVIFLIYLTAVYNVGLAKV